MRRNDRPRSALARIVSERRDAAVGELTARVTRLEAMLRQSLDIEDALRAENTELRALLRAVKETP